MVLTSFGLSVSSKVFHVRIGAVIKTVAGLTGTADDVMAKGDNVINHDRAVLSLLETTQNNNLKFNPDKIQFKTSASFLGSFSPQIS